MLCCRHMELYVFISHASPTLPWTSHTLAPQREPPPTLPASEFIYTNNVPMPLSHALYIYKMHCLPFMEENLMFLTLSLEGTILLFT